MSHTKKILKRIPVVRDVLHYAAVAKGVAVRRLGLFVYNKILLPRLLKKLRGKEKLSVAFTSWNVSMWKYHLLYKAMEKYPRFDPVVVLTPSPYQEREVRERNFEEMRKVFSERNYKLVECFDCGKNGLDFGGKISPDIVCFTQPYSPGRLCHEIWNRVFLYCPYGFPTAPAERWQHDTFMQNIAWKIFCATQKVIDDAITCTTNHAKNCVFTGYLFGDELSAKTAGADPWKRVAGAPKRIIWSPHFSIAENSIFHLSNFLRLHQVMLDFAEEFCGKIQWAFKPHPWLFGALCKNPDWGHDRATAYFEKWKNLENAQLGSGNYANLFANSDAIIHDCGSFTVEYLYTKKPGMYLMIPGTKRPSGALGDEALACYYQGVEAADIRRFIEDVVLGGNDPKREERERFYEKYLLPPGGQSVAQNIMDEIERGLGWKK